MLGRAITGFVGLIFFALPAFGQEPDWALKPPELHGAKLLVACHGVGPDRDIAIRLALDQCKSLAAEQLNNTFEVKSLSVETEEMAGFHQEVSAKHYVQGLVCDIQKQYERQINDSQEAWILCRMDTSKVKISPEEKFSANVQNDASDQHIDNKGLVQSRYKQMVVSSVPPCQSMLIRGKLTRMVRCESNPQIVTIEPSDKEVIVRAQGYKPGHVTLSGNRTLVTDTQTLEVYLEK